MYGLCVLLLCYSISRGARVDLVQTGREIAVSSIFFFGFDTFLFSRKGGEDVTKMGFNTIIAFGVECEGIGRFVVDEVVAGVDVTVVCFPKASIFFCERRMITSSKKRESAILVYRLVESFLLI